MSWNGLEVAILSPTPIWPQDHGNRKRINSLCQKLRSMGAKIHFIHYPSEHDWRHSVPDRANLKMSEQLDNYYVVPPTRDLHPYAIGEDHTIDEWWDDNIGNFLKWFFGLHHVDAFIVEYTWLSKALEFAPSHCVKILDTHDKFANRREVLSSLGISPEFFYTTEDQERIAVERADLVWSIKDQEENYFRELADRPVDTLVHWEEAPPVPVRAREGFLKAGIIGARNSINYSNLTRFLDMALPMFQDFMAPVKIVIAGGVCADLEDFSHPNVEVLGRVDDVREFYESLDLAIVPMDVSTGLKIKVAEAICQKIPVVSHRHAFEGFPVRHPYHELGSFKEIALALIRLSFDGSELKALREATVKSSNDLARIFNDAIVEAGEFVRRRRGSTALLVSPWQVRSPTFSKIISDNANYLSYASSVQLLVVGDDGKPLPEYIQPALKHHHVPKLTHIPAAEGEDFPPAMTAMLEECKVMEVFDWRSSVSLPRISQLPAGTRYTLRHYPAESYKGDASTISKDLQHIGRSLFSTVPAMCLPAAFKRRDALPYFQSTESVRSNCGALLPNRLLILYDPDFEAAANACSLIWDQLQSDRSSLKFCLETSMEEQVAFFDDLLAHKKLSRRIVYLSNIPARWTLLGELFLRCNVELIERPEISETFTNLGPIVTLSKLTDILLYPDQEKLEERIRYKRESFNVSIANDAGWSRIWRSIAKRKNEMSVSKDDPFAGLQSFFDVTQI